MHRAFQRSDQRWTTSAQLGLVMQRELAQYLFALGSQRKQHLAPVLASAVPPHVTARRQPVHQFDRAVVLNLHPLRQFADSRTRSRRQTLQGQHQLVLPRFETGFPGSLFAEVKKTADLIAQLRQ